jgi:hypothetical protein
MTTEMAINQARIDVDWLATERPCRQLQSSDAVLAFDFGPLPVMTRQAFWGCYLAAFSERIDWWKNKEATQ